MFDTKRFELLEDSGYAYMYNAKDQIALCYSDVEGVGLEYDKEKKLWFIVKPRKKSEE